MPVLVNLMLECRHGMYHLLLDEHLLNPYTRDHEVGIRLCDMVPHHLGYSDTVRGLFE